MNMKFLLLCSCISFSLLPHPHLFLEVAIGESSTFKVGTHIQNSLAVSLSSSTEKQHLTLHIEPILTYSPSVKDLNSNVAKFLVANHLQKIADRFVNDRVDIKTLKKNLLEQKIVLEESLKTETDSNKIQKIKLLLFELNTLLEEPK